MLGNLILGTTLLDLANRFEDRVEGMIARVIADPDKTQVHFDLHAQQGTRSMDAPRISPLGPDWEREMKIPLFHSFTFE